MIQSDVHIFQGGSFTTNWNMFPPLGIKHHFLVLFLTIVKPPKKGRYSQAGLPRIFSGKFRVSPWEAKVRSFRFTENEQIESSKGFKFTWELRVYGLYPICSMYGIMEYLPTFARTKSHECRSIYHTWSIWGSDTIYFSEDPEDNENGAIPPIAVAAPRNVVVMWWDETPQWALDE